MQPSLKEGSQASPLGWISEIVCKKEFNFFKILS